MLPVALILALSAQTEVPKRPLEAALKAVERAKKAGRTKRLLTLIDYSKPSAERRLWVIDLSTKRVLFHELVAHGKGSGDRVARRFSNEHATRASSLGLFETLETYEGKHGYSLKLRGLDPGVNDNAEARAIVVHAAWYVSDDFAKRHGRLGRSWGCPALDEKVAKRVIDTIKGESFLFAYHPSMD
jgi:hypothetical protein